jgi:mono/diheme cytochrome c family protein
MKKIVLFAGVVAVVAAVSGLAFAKAPWKKDLGAENCAVCHLEDKKAPNPDNKLWKAAKEWNDKTKAGSADTKGKSCADCHQGKMKPPK